MNPLDLEVVDWARRHEFKDDCLKAYIGSYPPTTILSMKNGVMVYNGINTVIAKEFASYIGKCVRIFLNTPRHYGGIPSPNGSFNGLMGLVQRKEVDIALAILGVNQERSRAADFSITVKVTDHMASMLPPTYQTDYFAFLKTLSTGSWATLLLSLMTMSLLITSASLLGQTIPRQKQTFRLQLKRFAETYSTMTLTIMLTLIHQAINLVKLEKQCRMKMFRILFFFWFVLVIVMVTAYETMLNTLMTTPSVRAPFTSFQDLIENHPEIDIFAINNSLLDHTLRTAKKGSLMHKAYKRTQYIMPKNGEEYTKMGSLLSTSLSLRGVIISKNFYNKDGSCVFRYSMANRFFTQNSALAVTKGFKYLNQLNFVIRSLKEAGILELVDSRYIDQKCKFDKVQETRPVIRKLTLEDFKGIYLLLFIGHGLGLIAFILEMMTKYMKRKNIQQ